LNKEIFYSGKNVIACCDENCNKAWGVQNRPSIKLSENIDDIVYLSDNETDDAPINPGTYEGGHVKPINKQLIPNKWCVRECERCIFVEDGEEIILPDFSKRKYNIPSLHQNE
jgi:hypothetical protein